MFFAIGKLANSDGRVFSLSENVPVSHALLLTKLRNHEKCRNGVSSPYPQTTTAQLRGHCCFLDRLVILNEDRILSNYWKKGSFEENPEQFLTAAHLVFLRPFPVFGHIATGFS